MARDAKRVYQVLAKYAPLSEAQMRELLEEEEFEMAWIGANNSHGKWRIAIIRTSSETYYGLTDDGMNQLREWEEAS